MRTKKRVGLLAAAIVSVALLASPVSVAYADTGVGSGGSGGSSGDADNGGYWAIKPASGNCTTPTLQKYFADGREWRASTYSYDATVANAHLLNQSIGAVNYTFNGQTYSSGNLPVTYGWIVQQEQGNWSWWSQSQAVHRDRGQVWIDSLSTRGSSHGQLIWACAAASDITTSISSTTNDTRNCLIAGEYRLNSGAWNRFFDRSGYSAQDLYNNCSTSTDFDIQSPGADGNFSANREYTVDTRTISRPVTRTSTTVTISVMGQQVSSQTIESYSQGANNTQISSSSAVIEPTRVNIGSSDLGYWEIDNRIPEGGQWVDSSGGPIDASDPNKHGIKLVFGELWDDNKPVLAEWSSLSRDNLTASPCWSEIRVPGQPVVSNPADLSCELDSDEFEISSSKIVDGRSVNLMSFAPTDKPSDESFTWSVNPSAGAADVVDRRLVRSINNQPIEVDITQDVDIRQPVRYGGYVTATIRIDRNTGVMSSSFSAPVYNTPYSYVYTGSAQTKILGGTVYTYTANNDH